MPLNMGTVTDDQTENLIDFARNVAGLDLYGIAHMSPDALRATLVELRRDAQNLITQDETA